MLGSTVGCQPSMDQPDGVADRTCPVKLSILLNRVCRIVSKSCGKRVAYLRWQLARHCRTGMHHQKDSVLVQKLVDRFDRASVISNLGASALMLCPQSRRKV